MFWCDEIDIVHSSNILEFDHPFSKLFWSQVESFSLMGNVMVLAEDASQIATREEYATAPVMTLYAGLFTKMRADHIHFDLFGAYEAIAGLLVPIDAAKTWTKIAVT